MNSIFQHITIQLLGLEEDLWNQTAEGERKIYTSAMLFYMAFLLIDITACIYLLFLITSSLYISLSAGLLLAGIVGNVVRFSLIILRKSIFDPEPPKKVASKNPATVSAGAATILPSQHATIAPVKDTKAVQSSPVTKSKLNVGLNNMLTKGKTFLMKRVTISLPKSDAAVPGLAGLIRLVIMFVLGLLVVFPFACLLHYKTIKTLNESKRDAYIQEYIEDEGKSFNAQTALIKKSILSLEEDLKANVAIYQEDGLLKEKKQELDRLNNELSTMTETNQVEFEQNLSNYRDKISDRYFIVLSFNAVTKYPFFIVALGLVICFLIMPHLLLYRLKTNTKFQYSKLSTDFYKSKIDEEYHKTNKWTIKYLKEHFSYDTQGFHKNIYWENPPYCTIKKEVFSKKKLISKEEFLKTFDQNNI